MGNCFSEQRDHSLNEEGMQRDDLIEAGEEDGRDLVGGHTINPSVLNSIDFTEAMKEGRKDKEKKGWMTEGAFSKPGSKAPSGNPAPMMSGGSGNSSSTSSVNGDHGMGPFGVPSSGSGASRKNKNIRPIKILMSGAGESGKSTVVKQMKIIHQGGFTTDELEEYRQQIYRNIQECILQLIHWMEMKEKQQHNDQKPTDTDSTSPDIVSVEPILSQEPYVTAVERVRKMNWMLDAKVDTQQEIIAADPTVELSPLKKMKALPEEYVASIELLWRRIFKDRFKEIMSQTTILDSAPYFMEEAHRIAKEGYIPTNEDVLRARVTTMGISEINFRSGSFQINMIDVGGQRSERRKWIETFDNVTTLIFCVALSEYDLTLREEPRQNRLRESLQLWESVINSRWFHHTSIILFLNKKDLFREKLLINPFERYFPEYKPLPNARDPGNEDLLFEHAADFVKNKFLEMNYGASKIYTYLTCATDTKNVDMVFMAVKETIVANNLRIQGFI